ncbi:MULTISPECIES: hypothetical protein [Burkholderia]|uniref:Uncharacterized protein n=1 Tax=Burkholderia pseudomultivorans TaxID=1207504 RepID=A0ABU2EC64_9BURK|nr:MULTISPECIES: hypothetical protein [Burkholderia]MBR8428318.1 hypothetical protein [Burkholderia cenocepacia]MDN7669352.1 hypothetical protein [Burkholderia vietnamiensis]MDR8731194.1 hypothetical protein [Burkholderia pseudomultivorans]MDR8738717.1 hypothetical protein [Burkholderia pseudomultivorans]MDR8745370.1 hypothetical protein [Burkholderia pseudomultivorans]
MITLPDDTGTPTVTFMVGYTLDQAHRVVVGIRASSADAAAAIARAAFHAGTLWDDTPDMPLLYYDHEELDGQVPQFDATAVAAWPTPHASVLAVKRRRAFDQLLAFTRLVDVRSLSADTIRSWHPHTLVGLSLTAGELRELRALLVTLADH